SDRAQSTHGDWTQKKQTFEQTASPRDGSELDRALDRARKQGDIEASLRNETSGLRTANEQAAADLNRLTLWAGSLEHLEELAVPSPETVERFDTELNNLDNEQRLLNTQQEENRQRT